MTQIKQALVPSRGKLGRLSSQPSQLQNLESPSEKKSSAKESWLHDLFGMTRGAKFTSNRPARAGSSVKGMVASIPVTDKGISTSRDDREEQEWVLTSLSTKSSACLRGVTDL